ncbi:ankyrin repeat domain-containing protein [Wolbachia endosymbiont of Diaphorina citri]|uniref:ankyrin repeat domain-containing protein n=1 Tax=Wolbachia endosymbiont of Diaphorina citri TaxID=116598 RepID=UPI00155EA571|nr:ankyrin repeat domain-containing protein [Wolbachia endosymbiont of Diaphorina citri]QJT94865.1 ankyrin repeat domain-containing protein [Wolbachia endosymbiont of Diaphorina citri]QJT96178.1 ankyrin repeat domain-containing protein [Wolbachia endosymbiont of Diaphorina citri]QLK11813.1 ankryin [Wolbachia endosymbiont of Diaphorina citri]
MLNASCSVNHAEKSLRLLKQQTPYQTRLISEDISSSNSQQTLKLPEGFTVGKAIRRGGCFFDAVAQGLKQLKPETNFTVKSFREVCRKQALSSQEMKKKIIADARNRGDSKVVLPDPDIDDEELWKTYLIGIEYSIEDIEKMQKDNKDVFSALTDLRYGSTLQVPIFGRPEIEGRMICNEYNVKLHVIENLLYSEWSSYLIDELGSRSVSTNYNEKDTIHIMNKGGCYFEPILRETPLMSEVQREFISIIEDSDLIEDRKLEKLKSFFKVYSSLNVNFRVNQCSDTPLHIAVCLGELKIVRFLLKIGAQVDVLNGEGKTPIDIARDNNRKDIAKILQPLVSYEEVDVPGDGSCLFWSVALAYLAPVKFDDYAFHERFKELFASDHDVHSIQRLMQSNANIYEDSVMRRLVTKTFRSEVADEVCFSQRRFENKVEIMDLFESHSGSYFTGGTFKREFEREFGAEKIKQCNIDISKLQPNFFDENTVKEICTELNKIKNRNEVQKFIFDTYLKCMEMPEAWGGKYEINAMSDLLKTTIIVSEKDSKDHIYNEEEKYFNKICLSYKGGNHYQFYQVKYSNLMKFVLSFIQSFEMRIIIYDVLPSTLREGNRIFFDGMNTNRSVRSIFGCSIHIDDLAILGMRASLRTGDVIKATKSFINLSDLIETFNEYKLGFRKIFVDAGCNIFQSFEMQFEKIGFDHISKIADDIVDKIIEYYIQKEYKKDLSKLGIAETLVLNTYLQEVSAQYGEISYNLKDLYENIGIVEGSEGSFIYYRRSEDKSSKYGYRRSLMGEKSKRTYDTRYIRVETTNVELENYVYTLDALNIQEFKAKVEEVFYIVNKEIQMPSKKVIEDLIVKIKSHIEQEVSVLSEYILLFCQGFKQSLDMNMRYLVEGEGIRKGKKIIERAGKNSDVICLMENNLKTIPNLSYYLKVKEAFVKHAETVAQDYSNLLESEHDNAARSRSFRSSIKRLSNVKKLGFLFGKMNFQDVCDPVEEFTGRQEQIEEIYRKLQKGAVIIVGPSGIGKTQLARKFVEENKGAYLHAYEVSTQDILSIESSFASFVRDRLAMFMEGGVGNKEKKKCLFLFQGVKKEDLERILKIRGQRGGFDCLFTSSDQDYQDIAEVSLDSLEEKEAVQLVKIILEMADRSQDEQIKALIRKLKCFPLAINLAAACIKNKGSSSLSEAFGIFEYLIEYERFNQKFPRNTGQNEYDRILQITLLISMETIEKMSSGEKILKILSIMAYFDHSAIDPSLFLTWIRYEDGLYSIFGLLEQYSIIYVEGSDKYKVYIMHELIKKAIRLQLSIDEERYILSSVIELISEAEGGFLDVVHLLSLFDHSQKYDYLIEENKNFPCLVLSSLNELHEYKKVINLTSQLYQLLAVDDGYSRLIKYEFACAQADLGLYDRALKIFLDLKKLEKVNDTFPPLTLDKKILSTYLKQKNYKEALSYVKYNNFIVNSLHGEDIMELIEEHLDISVIIAEVFVMQKRYTDAFTTLYYVRRLRDEIFLKISDFNSDNDPYLYPSEMYELYNLDTKYIYALAYFFMVQERKKVTINEGELSHQEDLPRELSIQALFRNLQDVLINQEGSQYLQPAPYFVEIEVEKVIQRELREKTLRYFEEVLKLQKNYGFLDNHPNVLSVKFYIAVLHSCLGDKEKALQELQQLQELQEKVIGVNHPSTLETVNAIQELFTEGEDKLTYLRNEIEKRESLLQFEKSDLNAKGVSILKELYVEKNSESSSSVSSEELLLGNKRFLDTESTKTKRRKMDNQQPASSFLDGIDIDSGYQQNDMVSLYR